MSPGILILVVVFAALLLLQTPIAFVIGIAAVLAAFALGYDSVLLSVARDLGNGLDSSRACCVSLMFSPRRIRFIAASN
jgi:hypothetical protein